jgi:hypothetical protein
MELYQEVFNAVPGTFHWKNGGVFKTETKDAMDVDGMPDDELDFMPHHGLFQHHVQLEAQRTKPTPSSLCVNNLVAVVLDRLPSENTDMPPETGGFRMGRIVSVDRLSGMLDVVWMTTKKRTFEASATWRPWMSRGATRVRCEDCLYTFHSLTSGGKLKKSEFRVLNYSLDGHAAAKSRAEISRDVLAGKAIPVVNPQFDISEYLEDHHVRAEVPPVPQTEKKKKKGKKRKKRATSGYAGDTDASVSSSVSGPSSSGGAGVRFDVVSARTYPARWFDDKCPGQVACACDFEKLILPNIIGVKYLVNHAFQHDCEKARLNGKEWSHKTREEVFKRMTAKGLTKRRR